MQFGFMKGKGSTDAIFLVRQIQEKFRAKGQKLYFGFVDLEKAFDRVPTEVIGLPPVPDYPGVLIFLCHDVPRPGKTLPGTATVADFCMVMVACFNKKPSCC